MAPYVTPLDYGAIGDGKTDDAAAFQTALDSGLPVHVPGRASGYKIGSPLVLRGGNPYAWQTFTADRGTRLFGSGPRLLSVTGSHVQVSGLVLSMPTAPTSAVALCLDTKAGGVLASHRYDALSFESCPTAIADVDTATSYVCDLQFTDCQCYLPRGVQVHLSRSRGHMLFRSFAIAAGQNPWPGLWDAAVFEDVAGLELERFDVAGGTEGMTANNGVTALRIAGGSYVRLTRVLIDGYRSAGIRLTNLDNVVGHDVQTYAAFGDGISLSGVTNSAFMNLSALGAKGIPGALPGATGITLAGCRGIQAANVRAVNNAGSGVVLYNAADCRLSNVQASGNGGWQVVQLPRGNSSNVIL